MTNFDPIPAGRRAALADHSLWEPMKGIVSKVAAKFEIEVEASGDLLVHGMSSGKIAHRTAVPEGQDYFSCVSTPEGADMVRRSGLDYGDTLDWVNGNWRLPGGSVWPLEIFWPDIERAALRHSSKACGQKPVERGSPRPLSRTKIEREFAAWLAQRGPAGLPPTKRESEEWAKAHGISIALVRQMHGALSLPLGRRRKPDQT
jgi:hypothetical protein